MTQQWFKKRILLLIIFGSHVLNFSVKLPRFYKTLQGSFSTTVAATDCFIYFLFIMVLIQ